MSRTETYWHDLGGLPPETLGEARIQLLHLAVVLGAAADVLADEEPDGRHCDLEYWPDAGALVTRPIMVATPMRLGMSLCGLEVVALDEDGGLVDSRSLAGSTLAEALSWVVVVARNAGVDDLTITLPRPLGIPVHPLASIGTFSEDIAEATQELGKYFADSQLILEGLLKAGTAQGLIRVVPEDLSMSVNVPLDDGERQRSIAVGFCPGDDVCDEPFWFLRPSPSPDLEQPPVMAEPGHWRSEGWQGAGMSASELFERTDAQHRVAEGFVLRALTLCRGLLA